MKADIIHYNIHWTHVFEWYMGMFGVWKGHQKDMCYHEIRLCMLKMYQLF